MGIPVICNILDGSNAYIKYIINGQHGQIMPK